MLWEIYICDAAMETFPACLPFPNVKEYVHEVPGLTWDLCLPDGLETFLVSTPNLQRPLTTRFCTRLIFKWLCWKCFITQCLLCLPTKEMAISETPSWSKSAIILDSQICHNSWLILDPQTLPWSWVHMTFALMIKLSCSMFPSAENLLMKKCLHCGHIAFSCI